MIVLVTGATGFIGRHLVAALTAAGHVVMEATRGAAGANQVDIDFTRDLNARDWAGKLVRVEAVVNAVGILREHGAQTFERIHTRAPQALFAACAAAGVQRVVQISALGADHGATGYFSSKRAADDYLAALPLRWTIVQPSLVYGEGGTSARLFNLLASLPITPLPAGGAQRVQPIHIDDLVEAVVNLLVRSEYDRQRIALVGPESLSLRDLLTQLRTAMGLQRTWNIVIPSWLMRAGARFAELSSRSLLDRDTLSMLQMGNTADPATTQRLLHRSPRPVSEFVPHAQRSAIQTQAKLSWLLPSLRISIALVWLWTGAVSLGLYPREASFELLARTGAPGSLFPLLLYGAATLDFALGAATLLLRKRRVLWLIQIALIATYTLIVTIKLPEYWLHPYGPILKNLPMLAAIYVLYELEEK